MKRFLAFPLLAIVPLLLIVATAAERPECIPMGPSAPVCGPADCTDVAPPTDNCMGINQEQVCECQMGTLAEAEGCRWSCWCEDTGGSDFPPGYVGLCPLEPWTDPGSCGPQPGIANVLCPDGVTWAGPTGRCLQEDTGQLTVVVCSWEIVECPPVVGACWDNQCNDFQCNGQAQIDCGEYEAMCVGDGRTCSLACCPALQDSCAAQECAASACGPSLVECPSGTAAQCTPDLFSPTNSCNWQCCPSAPPQYTCDERQCMLWPQPPEEQCISTERWICRCLSSSPGLEECSWSCGCEPDLT